MSINLNFGTSNSFKSTTSEQLKAWEIHEVSFDGAEYSEIQGKKDPNANYEILKFTFSNADGKYTESFFAPKAGDEVRKTRQNAKGDTVENPSNVEVLMKSIGHIVGELAPDNLAKMMGKPFSSFKQFAETVVKATDSAKGKVTKLKLIGDKEGKAKSPFIVSVFSNGDEAKVSNNFIGEKLFFTTFELSQKEKMQTAVPTNMAALNKPKAATSMLPSSDTSDDDGGDIDFDLDL